MRATLRTFQRALFAVVLSVTAHQGIAQEMPDATAAETPPAYAANPGFQDAYAAAKETGLTPEERMARWKKANELSKRQCMECFRGVINEEFHLRRWKDAVTDSVLMDRLATTQPDKLYAEASAGRALMLTSPNGVTLEQVTRAEGYLNSALAINPKATLLLFQEGRALATMHREDDAKAVFQRFLESASPENTSRELAEQYVKNPQQASLKLADAGTAASAGTVAATQMPVAQPVAAEPAYTNDPKFQKALTEAKTGRQTNEERLDNWKHANKLAKGQCIPCLRAIIPLQIQLGAVKDAVNSTQQLAAISTTDHDLLFAKSEMGAALMSYNYGQPKAEQVTQADAAFKEVLAKSPKSKNIVYQDGRALAMMGKDAEAKAMFESYVDLVPASDPLRTRAERFSDDPHLATLQMAPPFRMVTAQGEQLQLDEMGGKVVLLDFWATWCGPCKETLPEIARIAKQYANDPTVVVISVSQDADASAWKAFVQKNNMTWPQYRDSNNSLGNAYGVASIPHFFTIDTDGVLRSEKVGSNTDVHGMVADLVKKAHKAEAQKAKATDKAGEE